MQNECDNGRVEPESVDKVHGKGYKMADTGLFLRLLKGVEGWNKWRDKNKHVLIDLIDKSNKRSTIMHGQTQI